MPIQNMDSATPRTAVTTGSQQSSAPQEAFQDTRSQHNEQPRQSNEPQGQQSLPGRLQDQLQDVTSSQLLSQNMTDEAVLTPDHPASHISAEPCLTPKGSPTPEAQSQSETLLTQAHTKSNQSSSRQRTAAVLGNTPVLSVSQPNSLSTPSTDATQLHTQLGHSGRITSLAAAEQQRSFSAVAAGNADEAPEAELSPMQRALRSLSSKGIQTNRSTSGQDSGEARTLRDGSSGKLGSQKEQRSNMTLNEVEVQNGQSLGDQEVQEPLSQRVGAVRELASRLNMRSDSNKHI